MTRPGESGTHRAEQSGRGVDSGCGRFGPAAAASHAHTPTSCRCCCCWRWLWVTSEGLGSGSGLGLSLSLSFGLGFGFGFRFVDMPHAYIQSARYACMRVRVCACVCAKQSKAVASSCPRLYIKMDNVLLYYTLSTANDALAQPELSSAQTGTLC